MSPELTVLIGLVAVLALAGLLIGLADLLGPTETRHISRPTHVDTVDRIPAS